jgi:type IV fimbrial biogenesis protein FimT
MRSNRGFSLIEIMVVVAVMAILASFAIPNIVAYRDRQRFAAAVSDVYAAIKGARSSAIKNNTNVSVLLQPPNRFTVFYDADGNGIQDAGDARIRSGVLQNDFVLSTDFGQRITFDGRGLITTAVSTGTVTLIHAVYGSRTLQATVTGNVRIR